MSSAVSERPLVVAALGGHAVARPGRGLAAREQRRAVAAAADALAPLAAGHRLLVTHGNGPQVGMLARGEGDNAANPLDVLDAETEGMIGYLIEQELGNRLPETPVATLLTQVEVAADDPAFADPVKAIGPPYDEAAARRLEEERGWTLAARDGVIRRLVPSPVPRRVPALDAIRTLVTAGTVVVCAGGGGIPAVRRPDGGLEGVEAVVDKDRITGLLARELGAAFLVLLTDVDAVWENHGRPGARAIREANPAVLRTMEFASGSMGPKVEAACDFVGATGGIAAIGALEQAAAILDGGAGTRITHQAGGITYW